jgi:hypothetical protein
MKYCRPIKIHAHYHDDDFDDSSEPWWVSNCMRPRRWEIIIYLRSKIMCTIAVEPLQRYSYENESMSARGGYRLGESRNKRNRRKGSCNAMTNEWGCSEQIIDHISYHILTTIVPPHPPSNCTSCHSPCNKRMDVSE